MSSNIRYLQDLCRAVADLRETRACSVNIIMLHFFAAIVSLILYYSHSPADNANIALTGQNRIWMEAIGGNVTRDAIKETNLEQFDISALIEN
ncbi:hypothetical protein RRG08_043107 [Elysia crispata]|uniref:Uncharacterized protein n=1 Tax=Elysia crispata TaxID=231223 RepID=A0AAE1CPI0_9GAST|nr:hypothetical protein RRG08_043107 [Elysia crispata]